MKKREIIFETRQDIHMHSAERHASWKNDNKHFKNLTFMNQRFSREKQLFELKEMLICRWCNDILTPQIQKSLTLVFDFYSLFLYVKEAMESILVKGRVLNKKTFTQKMVLKAKKLWQLILDYCWTPITCLLLCSL